MFRYGTRYFGEPTVPTAEEIKSRQKEDRLIARAAAVVGAGQLITGDLNAVAAGMHNLGNGLNVLEDTNRHQPNQQSGRRNFRGLVLTGAMAGLAAVGATEMMTGVGPNPETGVEIAVIAPSLALNSILVAGVLRREGYSRLTSTLPQWLALGGAIAQNYGVEGVRGAAMAVTASGLLGLYNYRSKLRIPVTTFSTFPRLKWVGASH